MSQHRGRIFTVTHPTPSTTTESCRDCGWSFTYRERPTPQQRNEKTDHICPDDLPQPWELALTDHRIKETL